MGFIAAATAFADDLQRYLHHEPIRARRDTVAYRAIKFARRQRWPLTAAAAVFLMLGAALYVVNRERVIAENRFQQLRQLSNQVFDGGQFAGEDEGVEGDVAGKAAAVELGHELRQLGEGKVMGAGAGVEAGIEAEIDCVRAVLNRGANAVAIAGGGEEFWAVFYRL